ncbi:MAG: DUF2249 domain-containing protein [Chitinophagales bacterium]|nr:DUF2249 domain-containing protein [Chitinophagales bacterium]
MLINERTKIAALLKHHPDALETIVAIAPDFKKLRNPILRAIMAGRTSIAMASKVGNCKPEDFFKALAPLGFEIDSHTKAEEKPIEKQPQPEFLATRTPEQIIHFDVRAMLAEGNDPLKQIQQKAKALNASETLLIINNFEPVPLIKLLEKQGFSTYVNHINTDTIETYFFKEKNTEADNNTADAIEENIATSGDWEQVLAHFQNNLEEIDVRHLEMPLPMITILEALETLPNEKALYVHHKRIPVFLLTELKERHFEYRIKEIQDGEVYLLIFKNR